MHAFAFIGGGNMASVIVGGLAKSGPAMSDIVVIAPPERTAEGRMTIEMCAP